MQAHQNPDFATTLARVRVVPVLTISASDDAIGLARALVTGGLNVLEITLRTPAALPALKAIAESVPEAIVGAGTVLTPIQASAAIAAGSRFIVAPGMTPSLIEAAEGWRVPFLPGAATASEVMALADLGYRTLKFFPAEFIGGAAAMSALAAPLAHIRFCPTGGITPANAGSYLSLPNVVAVGGSWVAPRKLIESRDWPAIRALAAACAKM